MKGSAGWKPGDHKDEGSSSKDRIFFPRRRRMILRKLRSSRDNKLEARQFGFRIICKISLRTSRRSGSKVTDLGVRSSKAPHLIECLSYFGDEVIPDLQGLSLQAGNSPDSRCAGEDPRHSHHKNSSAEITLRWEKTSTEFIKYISKTNTCIDSGCNAMMLPLFAEVAQAELTSRRRGRLPDWGTLSLSHPSRKPHGMAVLYQAMPRDMTV